MKTSKRQRRKGKIYPSECRVPKTSKEEDTTDEKLQTAIGKEYRKEFIGEGQWFFYCKRTDQATLPNVQVPFSKAYYVLPIPDQELEYGNRN